MALWERERDMRRDAERCAVAACSDAAAARCGGGSLAAQPLWRSALVPTPDYEQADAGQQGDRTEDRWNGERLALLYCSAHRADTYRFASPRVADSAVHESDDAQDDQNEPQNSHVVLPRAARCVECPKAARAGQYCRASGSPASTTGNSRSSVLSRTLQSSAPERCDRRIQVFNAAHPTSG